MGITTSGSSSSTGYSWWSFKSYNLLGCWNWLAIHPFTGVGWWAWTVEILGDFGLVNGDCLGETDFLCFLVGFGVGTSCYDYS